MPTVSETILGLIAGHELDSGALSRLSFWDETLGSRELEEITVDDVDAALVALARRGRLRPSRTGTTATGQPLKGSTLNRYLVQLSSLYVFARKNRLIPRTFAFPTRGLERHPEPPDPERYLKADEIERLLACAKLVDRRWGKLTALIRLLATTGLRIGNAMNLRWEQVDLERRTIHVPRTKNGDPITVAFPQSTAEALAKLPGRFPSALVFAGPTGRVFHVRKLWKRAAEMAGMPKVSPHWLRHSAGYRMAQAGVSQPMIMKALGHKSLAAAARYVHQSVDDKLRIAEEVFG